MTKTTPDLTGLDQITTLLKEIDRVFEKHGRLRRSDFAQLPAALWPDEAGRLVPDGDLDLTSDAIFTNLVLERQAALALKRAALLTLLAGFLLQQAARPAEVAKARRLSNDLINLGEF